MADRIKRLERELGLSTAPLPFTINSKNICRRVEDILSEEEIERKYYMRHKIRLAVILVATAVALTTTALAAGPAISEMLQKALGTFTPYAQRVDDITAVDQGLEVKIVSALSDGNIIRVYFEARDLEADRLDEATTTNFWLEPPPKDHTGWATGLECPAECLHYDPETKTALFASTLIGDGQPASGLTLTAQAQYFAPGHHEFRFALADMGAPKTVKSKVLDSGETVLVPEQIPMALENDAFSLSSYGFGSDGRLHILYKSNVPMEKAFIHTYLSSRAYKAGDQTYLQKIGEYIKDFQAVIFRENGVTYYDSSYDAGIENSLDILPSEIFGNITSGETINGSWKFEIPLVDAPVRKIDMGGSGNIICGVEVKSLTMTALGVTIEGDPHGSHQILNYPLTFYLSDGSLRRVEGTDSGSYNDDRCTNHWSFKESLDVDQVVGVAIGMWYIPMENGVAGEGYWLSSLPE